MSTGRPIAPLTVTAAERESLERWVERRSAPPRLVLRHMRGDRQRAAAGHKVAGVVALVAAQRDPPAAGQAFWSYPVSVEGVGLGN